MTALDSLLVVCKPREKAGPTTGSRYAFQAHVSLEKLIRLHTAGVDYYAIFDHYDDLALLEKKPGVSELRFYQIKGKAAGSWTTAALCKAEVVTATPSAKKSKSSGQPKSIIGKMYFNLPGFNPWTKAAVFVTNASFSFKLAGGKKSTFNHVDIALTDLDLAERQTISDTLDVDFPAPRVPAEPDLYRFEVTPVPLKGYDSYLIGEMVKLLPIESSALGLYRTLIAEIITRANDAVECSTLEEVYSRKALGKTQVDAVFSDAKKRSSLLDHWAALDAELQQVKAPLGERVRLQTEIVSYLGLRSRREKEVSALSAVIRAAIPVVQAEIAAASGFLSAAQTLEAAVNLAGLSVPSSIVLKAALLVEAYEAL